MPIHWPPRFDPARAPVHVRNDIDIAAPCDRVWAWLTRATLWPSWYDNASDVRFVRGAPPDLEDGTQFRWRTFGVRVDCTVLEFLPPFRIAWQGEGVGLDVYHAWLLEPSADGCHVTTEETQYGALCRAGALLLPKRMWRGHQRWLESLRAQALQGPPPAA